MQSKITNEFETRSPCGRLGVVCVCVFTVCASAYGGVSFLFICTYLSTCQKMIKQYMYLVYTPERFNISRGPSLLAQTTGKLALNLHRPIG